MFPFNFVTLAVLEIPTNALKFESPFIKKTRNEKQAEYNILLKSKGYIVPRTLTHVSFQKQNTFFNNAYTMLL